MIYMVDLFKFDYCDCIVSEVAGQRERDEILYHRLSVALSMHRLSRGLPAWDPPIEQAIPVQMFLCESKDKHRISQLHLSSPTHSSFLSKTIHSRNRTAN